MEQVGPEILTNGRIPASRLREAYHRFRVHTEGLIYLLEDFAWILLLGPMETLLPRNGTESVERVGNPIVAVHGFGQTRDVFRKMKHYMKHRGREFHLFNYFTPQSIPRTARQLSKYIDRVLLKTGADKVDLMGHSLGGLVVRYYVQALGGGGKVSHCITLGAPHSGTRIALYIPVLPSMVQMNRILRANGFCRKLNLMKKPAGVRFINVYSPYDFFVQSEDRGYWSQADKNICLDFAGHLGMIMDYRFFDVLLRELRTQETSGKVIQMPERMS